MSGGKATVYLHVGIAKTGTTYLQNRFWVNREVLAEQGLLYPGGHRAAHFHASVDLRDKPFVGDRSTHVPGAWQTVATAAREAPDRALISHETLSRATEEDVDRALESLEPAEVHIVVTVRDLARQIPAVWQEMIKNRGLMSYDELLAEITADSLERPGTAFWLGQDFVDVLRRWTRAIPPEHVHVVTVPPRGAPHATLWERYCSVVGVDPSRRLRDVAATNISMGAAQTEFLFRINRRLRERLDWPHYSRTVKHGLVNQLAALEDAFPLRTPAELQDWLEQRSNAMIDGLVAAGYHVVGSLDDLRPAWDQGPVIMPDDVPDDQLLDIAGQMLAHVLFVNDRLQREGVTTGQRQLERVRSLVRGSRLAPLVRRAAQRARG